MNRMDMSRSKVLLVDDKHQSLDLLMQVLVGFRIKTTKACISAKEAREALAATTFDLIIIDGEMPDEDGIELTRHIRSQSESPNFTAPVIVVSAHTPREKVLRARDAGAHLVVKKPIAPATLLDRIERLARSARQFVAVPSYRGPDRRFKSHPLPEGVEERRADALALTSDPSRALSQNEVDKLFG